jgi:hypothetical protein
MVGECGIWGGGGEERYIQVFGKETYIRRPFVQPKSKLGSNIRINLKK